MKCNFRKKIKTIQCTFLLSGLFIVFFLHSFFPSYRNLCIGIMPFSIFVDNIKINKNKFYLQFILIIYVYIIYYIEIINVQTFQNLIINLNVKNVNSDIMEVKWFNSGISPLPQYVTLASCKYK